MPCDFLPDIDCKYHGKFQKYRAVFEIWVKTSKQEKYTKDHGWSNLYQQEENNFWSKMIFEQKKKKSKNAKIMHNLCLIMLAINTIFIDLLHITLPKHNVKFQPHPLNIF